MKIMIVDDEVIIRTGLAQVIDWKELGLELLEPAASAEEALERIPSERPSLLLTDIRMSGMTGLQLAEEAKRIVPDMEVVILSGYDDFMYTQQAIRQDVSDYLLKTSRPEEIIRTVLRAKRRIEEKWARLDHDFQKNKVARDRLFERWIVEGPTADRELMSDTLPHVLGEEAVGASYLVFMVTAEGWDASSESLLQFAVDNMLNELIRCETLLQKHRIVAAVRGAAGEPGAIPPHHVFAKIERLLKCRLTIAVGEPAERPELLHRSYESADYAFAYKGLVKTPVLDIAELRLRKGGKRVLTHGEELELSSLLLQNDQVALNGWVQRLLQERLDDPQMTLESLEASLHSVVGSAHRWLQRAAAMTGRKGVPDSGEGRVRLQLDEALKDSLFRYLYSIMKLYHHSLAEGQTSYVQKAIAYIEEHIEEGVALQHVAKQVHVHPSHLSEVFKKETGMSFGDYVVRKKLERAKELLVVSPAKISEIASKLGYEDVKYFGQLFKKYTGKTPTEFRAEASQAGRQSE
jgi:two-component system response regulator YesN